MKRIANFCVFVGLILSCSATYAQTIKALIFADTFDGSIGAGIIRNEAHIGSFLDRIEIEGQMPVERVVVDGPSFHCSAILAAIDSLKINTDDTVVFYYSGHGFRLTTDQSSFPELDCRRLSDDPAVDMSTAVSSLVAKQPRFVLAIADTCNVELFGIPPNIPAGTVGPAQTRRAALKRLFLGYRGTLMISGAVPGEASWYMTSGDLAGGFFTTQFLSAINQHISLDGDAVRWEDIANDGTKPIFIPNGKGERRYQNPQYFTDHLVRNP